MDQNVCLVAAPRLQAPHLSMMRPSLIKSLIVMTAMAHDHHHDREGGRYHKRVKPWSLATETGCWLGRVQPPRGSWCPVAQMEAVGTSSLLRPLRGLIGTLK